MTYPDQARNEVLHVSFLGEFRLAWGKTAVSGITTPSHQSLFAYLILNRDLLLSRRQLAFQFWPDSTESQARTNLRKAIYLLRNKLPHAEQFLRLENNTIQWNPNAPFTLDVAQFEKCFQLATPIEASPTRHPPLATSPQPPAPSPQPLTSLQQAITLYRGDLLPDHYDEWIVVAREQLRRRYLSCLDQLIRHLEDERQYPDAIHYARRLLREDPLHEAAYRRLMRLQALSGNVAGALRVYHTCTTTLQRELDISPSKATQEAYDRLLQVEAPTQAPLPARVPLVAQEQNWITLQTIWRQAAREQPQVVLLTGEAGIGKTRMAEELLNWTRRQGITTITAVCYAAEGQLPYAPIADWLRTDDIQAVLNRVADKWLVECARLLPELLTQRPQLMPPGPLVEGWQRQHFFTALAHMILTARQPLLLFVDDLQWADQDTLDWLHFLLRFDKQARLLLMGAVRVEEITPDHPLVPWQQFMQRDSNLTTIRLNRLDAEATGQLAAHITRHSLSPEQSATLYAETEGIPLFIVETARASLQPPATNHQQPTTNLPLKVQTVIESRLSQLSPQACALINLAAVIGRSFTFDLLIQASRDSEETIVRGLDELWQRRIVREQGAEAYDFSHDKLRQVAYAALSTARRRLLHGRIIKALTALHANNPDEVSSQLAAHYEAVQELQEAVQFYLRAAQVSNRVFAHQETLHYLRRAIALLPQTAIEAKQQAALYELLGDVLALTGELEEAKGAFETAVSHTSNRILQSKLYRKMAHTCQVQKEFDKAFHFWQIAEKTLGEPTETADAAWWQEWLWIRIDRLWVLYLMDRGEEMSQQAEQIRPILDQYGLPDQRGYFFLRLANLAFRSERYVLSDETVRLAQAALAAVETSGQARQISRTRFGLGMAHLWHGWTGNLDEAMRQMQTALTEAEEIGDVVVQSRCLAYLTLNYRRRGEMNNVHDMISRARQAAEKANMVEYVMHSEMHGAWVAWREGNLEQVQRRGQAALDTLQSLPLKTPFLGEVLWPLMGAALRLGDVETAVSYIPILLAPNQRRMPDTLNNLLQQALTVWDDNQPETARIYLQQSLQMAQEMKYL